MVVASYLPYILVVDNLEPHCHCLIPAFVLVLFLRLDGPSGVV